MCYKSSLQICYKISKMSMIKFIPKVLDQKDPKILKSINRLLITCPNVDQFCLL